MTSAAAERIDAPDPRRTAARPHRAAARLASGTGATLALAIAGVAGAGAAQADGGYTVRPGDTVSHIALRHGTTVAAVVAANNLDDRALIRIGQRLAIPGAAVTPAPRTKVAKAAPVAATHKVVPGDTVSHIATRYGTTVAAVVQANKLDARALIRIGQVLTIPGKAAPTAAAPRAKAPTATTASYTVAPGDTVSRIAAKFGTTVSAVVKANKLDARAFIRIGQKLAIPGVPATTSTALVGNTFAGRTYASSVVAAANANKATLLARGVPSKATMQAKVAATARAMGVDPRLAQAVAFQESGFNHTAVSPANAIGTMQVIPSSGEWASDLVGRPLDLLDPDDNVVAGVAILRALVRMSPDLPTAIAGYYQGAGSVKRNGMFADTRRYVANVQTHMTRF